MPTEAKSVKPSVPPTGARVLRPFLKWVGGKRQLLEQFAPLLPERIKSYHEPFVGGAALFFELRSQAPGLPATLSDVNGELVDCYVAVRDCVDDVLGALARHKHDSDWYYEVRAQRPADLPLPERAARTIFLNKCGYNGLFRVNKSGQFNVPFGRYDNPNFLDEPNLRACSEALAGVAITQGDFSTVMARAKKGDFVYFDPPYVPVSRTADFTAYVAGGFGDEEQRSLADVFARLAKRGVDVMLSNSDTDFVHELYAGFDIQKVSAGRSVNSKGSGRGKLSEVLVRSYR